jgi:hydroxyacylglutathione hydrolase
MSVVARDDSIQIDRLTLGPYETNSYVLTCRLTGDSVVVDAPGGADKIIHQLKGTNPRYILITHAHMDHTGALSELKSRLGIPVGAHPLDAKRLSLKPEILLGEGDSVSFGKIELKVRHTPGHTPGSVCFLTGKYLIAGDTIFPTGPGKTQSPDHFKQIVESITSKIFPLPEDTQIYPGHGNSTVLKKEKAEFAIFSSRPHEPDLCGDVLWLSS